MLTNLTLLCQPGVILNYLCDKHTMSVECFTHRCDVSNIPLRTPVSNLDCLNHGLDVEGIPEKLYQKCCAENKQNIEENNRKNRRHLYFKSSFSPVICWF